MAELTERHSLDKTGHSQNALYYTKANAMVEGI